MAKPSLVLYFDAKDRPCLPVGMRAAITLEIEQVRWRGTIATTSGTNPPYVHTWLKKENEIRKHATDLWLELGFAENAKLEFAVKKSGEYELIDVLNRGGWRQGKRSSKWRKNCSVVTHLKRPRKTCFRTNAHANPSSKTVTDFPIGDTDEILRLAKRYWELITPRDRQEETTFEADLLTARSAGFLTKSLFVRLARWKSPRNLAHYESNSENAIHTATSVAFTSDDIAALQSMMQLKGVALRTASAMLHWMRPDRFPVLDFRVVGALKISEPHRYENLKFYCLVADRVRELAAQHSLDLRAIDRALWTWHKEHSTR